jgi:hypothetical protein
LRSYALIAAMNTNGGQNGGTAYQTPYSNAAFIQFAGFTAGSTASFFDFDGQPYSNITPLWSSSQGGNGIALFAYTAQLGNGLSATISAEDPTNRSSAIGSVVPTSVLGGRKWPDVVGNLRIDQAWGSAQVMGAIHDTFGATSATSGISDEQVGFAVGAGLKFNLPMLGKGDAFTAQVTYSKGATNYLLVNNNGAAVGIGGNAILTGFPVVTNTALNPVFDGVFIPGTGSMDLTTGWDVTAGYEHNWVPGWKTSLYGSYGQVRYTDAASAALAVQAGAGTAGSASWNAFQIGSRTVWTPVANLDLSVDVVYTKYETAFGGSTSATFGTFEDKGFLAGIFRAQRNFYP